ncbi:MAG: TolC family protein [Bacteroidales bacterium]|nr:TolC family protein [Candidatus Colimorpha merdihippi]MCQ2281757.1 TolC family protein [Bacteroidales bacterium]
MKARKLILALLVSVWGGTAIHAQQTETLSLSLDEAQQYAVEHNYALQNATLDVRKAEASKWQAIASMLPQIKAGFDYQNMCGYEMNFGSRGGGMSSMIPDSIQIGGMWMPIRLPEGFGESEGSATSIPMNPSGNFSITASIALTGAQIVGIGLSNIALDMANISNKQSLMTTKANVKSVYTSILVMEQTVQLLNSSLNNMQQLYESTLASVKAGAAEQISADKFAIQVASLRNSINSTRRTLEMLYNSLLLQLGADVNSKLHLTTQLDQLLNVDYASKLTMGGFNIEDNYSYQLLNQSQRLSEKQLSMAWMDFTPVISAYYQYSAKTYFGKSEGFNMTPPNMIGASVSLPIFQSGARMAKIKGAKIDLQETINSKQQAEDGLRVQYNQLSYDLISSLESYQIQKDNLEVTQRVLDNTSEKYKYGHASNLEVTTANTDLITAQSNYIQAVMNVISAQVALENLLCKE